MSETELPRFMVRVDTLPTKGFAISLEPSKTECDAIAKHVDVLSVSKLIADLKLHRWRQDGVRVAGTLAASIEQACVVTLDPVTQEVRETIAATYLPQTSKLAKPELGEVSELVLDPEGEDPPEIFSGNSIDVWAVTLEALLLAIDPFPRSSGANLPENVQNEAMEAEESPFAALGQLKTGKK